MTEHWFSEVPAGLAFLALLAILAWPASEGRFKKAMVTIWIAAITIAGLLFAGAGVALAVQQPSYVVRSLALLGLVFGFSFGASFPALLHAYREAELRKTIAADL
jgi:hypothetical protein